MAEAMRDDGNKETSPMTDADFCSPAKPKPYSLRGVPNSASLADLSLSAPDALASLSVSVALTQEKGEESESSSFSLSSSESQTQSSGPSPEPAPPPNGIHIAFFGPGPASGPIAPPPQTEAQGSPSLCEEARLLDVPLPAAAAPGTFSAEGMLANGLSQHNGQPEVTPPEMGVAAPWQITSAGPGGNFGMRVDVEGGNGNNVLLHDPLGPLGWSGEESGQACQWMGVGQAGGMGVMMGWDDGDAVGDSRVGWDGGRSFQIDRWCCHEGER